MAIVNLGTQDLFIGGGAVSFAPFPFKDNKAYLVKGQFNISNPRNLFSYVRIRGWLNISGQAPFWAAPFVELEIIPEPFSFFYPFSRLYDDDGTVTFFAERLPLTFGAGEVGTQVSLNLFYDDDIDTGTWL